MASITLAGESLIAQKQGAKEVLRIVRFLYANVPGLDPNLPVDRAAPKPPPAQIVFDYELPAENSGYVNPNQVVYSSMLGSDIGDFDWNWLGLESAEGVLFAVAYVPLQQKRRNIPPLQIGNNVTRNVLVEYSGAKELTGISVDASTWQHDFTVRLAGIDERERVSNHDIYGRTCFFAGSLQLELVGSNYQLRPGCAYVAGIRIQREAPTHVTIPSLPCTAWLDVSLQRHMNDAVATINVRFGDDVTDYKDSAGAQHYLTPLATVRTSTDIVDRRVVEPIESSLVQHLAARTGDYPKLRARATTKADVGLDQIPNAVSDDSESDSAEVLATTSMVQLVRRGLSKAISNLVEGVVAAGKATKLATARTFRFTGAASGSVLFDGTEDANVSLTLADSGVAKGKYFRVDVNAKGLVVAGNNPTTLAGFGITDAYSKDQTNAYFVKQGNRLGQLNNTISLGWSGRDLLASVDNTDLGNLWYSKNFDPASKADASNVYSKTEVENKLSTKATGDAVSVVGFASGNFDYPYFRHINGNVYYLQRAIGFNPPEQGGGAHQRTNKLRIGWSSAGIGLRYQVDAIDQGLLWGENNFYRPDAQNFFPIAVTGSSFQLPSGGTWCYSIMAYYADGRGVYGKSGIVAGGTAFTIGGAATIYGFAWRFSA